MKPGAYTALATPFSGDVVDYAGLEQLIDFQTTNGITGILAVGTTGESPVLSWEEHNKVIEITAQKTKGKCACIAGTGSNNTKEALTGAKHAADVGVDAVLLVDPYYNGPSSLEIRKEYVEPIAAAVPGVEVIPYVIPGRTGAQLLPEDLAILHQNFTNVSTVKEATGDLENMKQTRRCCGSDFIILSGDDGLTAEMMLDAEIKASGVISVITNLAPKAVTDMVFHLGAGEVEEGKRLNEALTPLFNLVTVKTTEQTSFGNVTCRARNPLALKTLMSILGMPAGGCRQPLGKMTKNGIEKVLSAARVTQKESPEILMPLAEFFNVDIEARLNNPEILEGLYYPEY
jgi:4-hydroxy-tetrahydrodipicolinate synthase